VLWGIGTALLTTLYGMVNTTFIPRYLFAVSFSGVVVTAICSMFSEFALRPVAAQALEAGPPPRGFAPRVMGRIMTGWALGSGVIILGIVLLAAFAHS
jgi:adenylate cyclase